jgi:hypothetical protein
MTDLDDRLRRDLVSLADRMPTSDLADGAVQYGQQIRRGRRATVAVIAVVAAVAAVVIPLSLNTGSSGSSTAKLAQKPPTSLPLPEGTTRADRPFAIAGPPSAVVTGLPQRDHRACTPAQTRATATLRPSPDGVVGVVDLTSSHHCAVQLDTIQMTLLDPAGQPLGVRIANPNSFIAATNEDSIPFSSFGFAWDGSWCGARAATLRVALKNGSVRAPLSGPQPECTGASNSMIIPGALGYIGDPVQGVPPEWRSLTSSLTTAPVTSGPAVHDLQVTLTNSSGAPVTLQPTPTYLISVELKSGAGGLDYEVEHMLPLKPGAFVVPAHGTLRITLPDEPISADIYSHLRGHEATVAYVMAGFAEAAANTRVTN